MSDDRPFLKKDFAGLVDETLTHLRSGVGGRVILDDATEGSVLRTLVEAFSRELAVCYEQLEAVYEASYLETATGAALDRVVELIGIARHEAGWLEGDAVFARATPAPFDIDIPAGTLVAGKGVQGFETLVAETLPAGQSSVRVPIRSLVPEGASVEPNKLSILNRPIPGIETVSNPAVLLPRRDPESDDDLRARALGAIRGGRSATVSAIERAVLALGIVEVSVSEDPERAGLVKVVIGDLDLTEGELAAAQAAVEAVRPVGVRVDAFQAAAVWIQVRITVELEALLDAQSEAALRAELKAIVREFFAKLEVNESVRWNKLRNLLAAHPSVAEVALPTSETVDDGELVVSPTWPLLAVDRQTAAPVMTTSDGAPRLLGTESAPVGVFVGVEERARLHATPQLDLQPPELAVWIDVEADHASGSDVAVVEAALREELAKIFPAEALQNPVSVSWNELSTRLDGVADLDSGSLRFVILHARDGRVVTVADDPAASEHTTFVIRERIEIRNVHLFEAED